MRWEQRYVQKILMIGAEIQKILMIGAEICTEDSYDGSRDMYRRFL